MTCMKQDQVRNRTSIAYIHTGGRLGNAMSSYAAMLALRHQFGIDAMVDLTTFQILDMVFSNVREVPIIEEKVCYTRDLSWSTFNDHIRNFEGTDLKTGKAIFFWPHGIASEEYIHGPAQLLLPSIEVIRKAFTFRLVSIMEKQLIIKYHNFRNKFTSRVKTRLNEILQDYTTKINKKRKSRKISSKSCELVCVHIRRGDHLDYEEMNGVQHLKKQYFLQAMDLYKEKLKHPVFIIVTDDPDWAFRQIHQSFKPYFTG